MLRSAFVMVVGFAVLSLLGGREAVSVLSGTMSSGSGALLGLGYAAAYFGALLLVPPLLVTGVFRLLRKAKSRSY